MAILFTGPSWTCPSFVSFVLPHSGPPAHPFDASLHLMAPGFRHRMFWFKSSKDE